MILEKNRKIKHLFFFFTAFVITVLYGYYFGTFDQVIHIPFLKKIADPTLYPNDHFFDLRFTHYSFFWYFFVPFYKAGLLEIALFIPHFITTYLTIWAIWKVSYTLFHNTLASLLTVVTMVFPHFGFSAFPFFEFSLLNRTFALPFELFALHLYLEKKTLRAVFLLGIIGNIHVISVAFLIAMIFLDLMIRIKSVGIGFIVRHIVVFGLGASPVLAWKLSQSSAELQVSREWFDIIDRGVLSHLFHFVSIQNPHINLLTLSGISALILFFLFISHKKDRITSMDISMVHFMYAGIAILFVQAAASFFAPSALIIAAQITRVGVFINVFCYLYAAHYVAHLCDHKSSRTCTTWLTGLFTSLSPFMLLVLYFLRNSLHRVKIQTLMQIFLWGIFVTSLSIGTYLGFWKPGIYIFPSDNAFNQVQIWARDNTPKDTLFITPPEHYWLFETEWRVLSERSTVVTISELLEAAFNPRYITYWKPRFEDIAPGALAQFNGNFLENKIITKEAYYRLATKDILSLGQKYNASYLVVEKSFMHKLPIVYENSEYRVYAIK